jgi:hypothetical protein
VFKTLAATTTALFCMIAPQLPAHAAVVRGWQPCAYAPANEDPNYLECRVTVLSYNLFRLDWADGKSDIFVEMDNGTIQDSRGGLWLTDVHTKQSGIYRSAKAVNSDMIIVWRVFS